MLPCLAAMLPSERMRTVSKHNYKKNKKFKQVSQTIPTHKINRLHKYKIRSPFTYILWSRIITKKTTIKKTEKTVLLLYIRYTNL